MNITNEIMDIYKLFKEGVNILSWNIAIEKIPDNLDLSKYPEDPKIFIFSYEIDNYSHLKSFIIINRRTSRLIKFYKDRSIIEVDKDILWCLRADMDNIIKQMDVYNFGYAKDHAIYIRNKIKTLI